MLVFRGGLFWTVTSEGNGSAPLSLKQRWPQLPFAIEAAAFSPLDGKLYFFNGGLLFMLVALRIWRKYSKIPKSVFMHKLYLTHNVFKSTVWNTYTQG